MRGLTQRLKVCMRGNRKKTTMFNLLFFSSLIMTMMMRERKREKDETMKGASERKI